MSETDDTDELLLIPPDFFLTNPVLENLSPYYNVVDSLISQVNHLENRINFIESSSEFSVSLISDSPEMQSPSRVRKFCEDGKFSTHSTPQKPRTKFTMSSLPNSPDIDFLKKPPQKKVCSKSKKADSNPMLGEIDSFISNVKLIKRLNTVRNLENDFNDDFNTKKLDINQVNEMLKEVELNDKKIQEKPCVKETLWHCGDTINSVPDYGFGIRKNFYPDSKNTSIDKTDSDSSESTQMTAYEKRKYKRKDDRLETEDFNLGLVSLAKLWKSQDGKDIPNKFQQKLQEERLRRQHCEQAIQDLQNRVLELQERVAVAIQVDEAKDKAILRFRESWEKAGAKLQEIEKQKEKLEEEVEKLRTKLNEDSEETNQKISHYEKETSIALNIAHSSQDKLITIEKRCQELQEELKTAQVNSEEFQQKYLAEVEKNRQYPEILAQKDLELNECKSILTEARNEVAHSKQAVEVCQSEVIVMKNENETLQAKLESERENFRKISEQKNKVLEELTAHKSITKGLQEELTKTREQIENNKIELKNFYQGQVEMVVQNKLKEFQKQLDEAEKALKEELSRKEFSIAKTAASHIQQISEKHSLEIKLLEEKHQEESRLYQLQITQLRHELEEYNLRIKRQNEKHVHIERQLHKFMESLKQDHLTTIDEMNSFRSKSFNNLEEILSSNAEDEKPNQVESNENLFKETPLSSRSEKSGKKRDGLSSLQDTIQMLLDKRGQGDEGQQAQYYQRMVKDMKGKPPWK